VSSSTTFPATVTDVATGNFAWTNPNNIKATDSTYATCAVNSANTDTDEIQGTNYGFSTSGTINGLVASLIGHVSNASRVDDQLNQFIKGGSLSGTNYGSSPTTGAWATSDSTLTFGTSTTLSGMTVASSDINASNFGFCYSSETNSNNLTISLDSMQVTVYYTAASPAVPVPLFPPGAMGLGVNAGITNVQRRNRVEGIRYNYN